MLPSRVRPDRISSPITSIAAVGFGMRVPPCAAPLRGIARADALSKPPVPGAPPAPLQALSRGRRCWTTGREVTAHCANPGSMTGARGARERVWLEPAQPGAQAALCLAAGRAARRPSGRASTPACPNSVVGEALRAGRMPELAAYGTVAPEVRYGESEPRRLPAERAGPARRLPRGQERPPAARRGTWPSFPTASPRAAHGIWASSRRWWRRGTARSCSISCSGPIARGFALAADIDPGYAAAAGAARGGRVSRSCASARRIDPQRRRRSAAPHRLRVGVARPAHCRAPIQRTAACSTREHVHGRGIPQAV